MIIYIFLWLMCKIYEFSNVKLTLCSLNKYKLGMIYTKYISGVSIYLCEQVDYFFLNAENPGRPVVFTLLTSKWRTLFQNTTVLDKLKSHKNVLTPSLYSLFVKYIDLYSIRYTEDHSQGICQRVWPLTYCHSIFIKSSFKNFNTYGTS